MSLSTPVLAAGTILHDTYEVVRRVGAGGMGEVYETRHARLPGRFAVKVLAARVEAGSPEFRRFRREAEIASSLRHPNLVQVVDFNLMADGSPYLVMEFLEGSDLSQELARVGRLSPQRTASIVGQVAAALQQAHAGGVVHRDLKPQNVFLVPLGGRGSDFVKVVDFGISKVNSAATVTTEPLLMGTPQYMSPEQARGRAQDVDAQTDQFALAAMAHEMLSGRPAFSGDSVPAILFAITSSDPPPLGLPFSSPEVETVVRRGLAKEKGDRFPSILEFGDALNRAIAQSVPGEPAAPIATRAHGRVPNETGTLDPAVTTARGRLGQLSRRRVLFLAGSAGLVSAVGVALVRFTRGRTQGGSGAPPQAVAPEPSTARPGVQVTPFARAQADPGAPDAGVAGRAPAPIPVVSDGAERALPRASAPRKAAVREPRRRQEKTRGRDAARPVQSEVPFIDKL